MNVCDSFIFSMLRRAVLLAKFPAVVITEGRRGSPTTSVPGGGDTLDLHDKMIFTSRSPFVPFRPYTPLYLLPAPSMYLRSDLGLKMQSLSHAYIVQQ